MSDCKCDLCEIGKELQKIADKVPEHKDFLLNGVFSLFEERLALQDENKQLRARVKDLEECAVNIANAMGGSLIKIATRDFEGTEK